MVYYSLDDDHVRLLVKLAIDHAAEGLTEPSGEGGNHHERREQAIHPEVKVVYR